MRPKIVLTGNTMAGYPEGGGHWSVRLQYLLGLRDLGYDFHWLELFRSRGDRCVDERLIRLFLARFRQYGLGGHCSVALHHRDCLAPGIEELEVFNLPTNDLQQFIDQTDLLWNFHCSMREPLLSCFSRKVLLDLDPGHLQVSALQWEMDIASHDVFLTVGLNLHQPDCQVPTLGKRWYPYFPPVYLPMWPVSSPPSEKAPFTSITQWNWGEIWLGDHVLSISKRDAYIRFLELPDSCEVPLELAANIDPDDQTGDREQLESHGWRLVSPHRLARTPHTYRDYILRSRGEFGCAKPIFSALRSGWFSDRSAAFLACGRPVVIENTGLSHAIPLSRGILPFASLQEARDQLRECAQNYGAHAEAARQMAEEHLDSRKVLPRLIELSFSG